MRTTELQVDTSQRRVVDLNDDILAFVRMITQPDGLLNVFVPHATAGVAIIETGAGSERDLEQLLERLIPRDDALYEHRHGSPGHGADHVLPAIVSPSVTIPFVSGKLALGTWQHIVLVDLNPDNPERTVRLSFLAG